MNSSPEYDYDSPLSMDDYFDVSNGDNQEFEDETVNMVQVEQEQELVTENLSRTVGNDDLTKCSYDVGYVPCQGVFCCFTCCPDDDQLAGVCSACITTCHKDHNWVALSNRRYFRCDCGNDKFKIKCLLQPDKAPMNSSNNYNHNFRNRFCTCDAEYIQKDEREDMLQCSICEDWFHLSHVDPPPREDDYEFVCRECSKAYPFLRLYADPRKLSSASFCKISRLAIEPSTTCLYLPHLFRELLCQCNHCFHMYITKGLGFLTDNSDDPAEWERKGRLFYGFDTEFLYSTLDPEAKKKVELISEYYMNLEVELKRYLYTFYVKKEVVTENHILSFFESFSENFSRKHD